MNIKFFNFILNLVKNCLYLLSQVFIFAWFYPLSVNLAVSGTFFFIKFNFLFLVPKLCDIFIRVYKKKFLFFYTLDYFLSGIIFLYFVNYSLEILFPIAGLVYNQILFEEEC